MSVTTELPGITFEELMDTVRTPPCEIHLLMFGRRWDRRCRRPAAFRVRVNCPSCGRRETACYCRPHTESLKAGKVVCMGCGASLSFGGML